VKKILSSDLSNTAYKDAIFGPLVAGRERGGCASCCIVLQINSPDLTKPADTLCPHHIGSGCGIYESRPDACRNWRCLWRHVATIPDLGRPDKTGVMFSIETDLESRNLFEYLYIVCRATKSRDAFKDPLVSGIIDGFVDQCLLPVWRSFDGQKFQVFPDKRMVAAIHDPDGEKDRDLAAKAREWHGRYLAILSRLGIK
jgi:hypothetical protein